MLPPKAHGPVTGDAHTEPYTDEHGARGPALRFALWCGGLPLATGCAIFLAWLPLGGAAWESLGLLLLIAGPWVVLAGLLALAAHVVDALRRPGRRAPGFWKRTILALGLLLANFPAALGIVLAASWISDLYTVVIVNRSELPLEEVRIEAGARTLEVPPVPPGGRVWHRVRIGSAGWLALRARSGTTVHHRMLDGSPLPGRGNRVGVVLEPDGTLGALRERR